MERLTLAAGQLSNQWRELRLLPTPEGTTSSKQPEERIMNFSMKIDGGLFYITLKYLEGTTWPLSNRYETVMRVRNLTCLGDKSIVPYLPNLGASEFAILKLRDKVVIRRDGDVFWFRRFYRWWRAPSPAATPCSLPHPVSLPHA